MPNKRILIVEQDRSARVILGQQLAGAGYAVTEASSGQSALDVARADKFDLLLLDVALPDIDGVTVCRAVRSGGVNQDTPLVVLTARGSEADTVLGLESGADDYMVKPVARRELLARLNAVSRRSDERTSDTHVLPRTILGRDVLIDLQKREMHVRGALIDLTPQEFDLIALLASHRGIVFSRNALLARIWNGADNVTARTVDAVVSRVRRKVERDPQRPEILLTAWGAGYKFSDNTSEPQSTH